MTVRIYEYDMRDFKPSIESNKHKDFTVKYFQMPPSFDDKKLHDNIAILTLSEPINLRESDGVNAACYPSCGDMFKYEFTNGTGIRCWVAGYGKLRRGDQELQKVLKKVDVPIFNSGK